MRKVLSDKKKRHDYDQFGRESVDGNTVFTDAKRYFALVFGGAAFEPYIGEMTMAFLSQLPQPEDEVMQVKQEWQLVMFQLEQRKTLARLLVARARDLVQKAGSA